MSLKRGIAQAHAVGTHIGNMAVLVKLLCDLHRSAHAVTQFSRCLLLQGRGRKGRGRRTFTGFYANIGYLVIGSDACVQKLFRVLRTILFFPFSLEGYGFAGDVIGNKYRLRS